MLILVHYCCWQPWSDKRLIAVGIADCCVRIVDSGMLSYKHQYQPFPQASGNTMEEGQKEPEEGG